jgi:hypothetical protein
MPENYQIALYVLCVVIPVEYVAISFASLISKIVVVNFLEGLSEASRSRETKAECTKMKIVVRSHYKNSLLWPLEFWRAFRGSK